MPIITEIDLERNLTIHTAKGFVTDDDMFKEQETFYSDNPTKLELWDMSESELSVISIQGLRNFIDREAQLGKVRRGGKSAVVVEKSLQFGLARTAETFGEFAKLPFEFKIFKTFDAAMEWLTESTKK
jgi:hypothetical protein